MVGQPNVLVTGAEGFVGSWMLESLARTLPAGAAVTATSLRGGGACRALDVTDRSAVDDAVRSVRPTCVVHLAAVSSPVEARRGAREAWTVNLFGTMNLAEAVMSHVPRARFIFAGSSEVYGATFNAGQAVDEAARLDPLSVYAATKASADLMLGQMAEAGLGCIRFRPFNHTGPGQSAAFAVPAFASQIAAIERGESPPVLRVGNLDARRDFLDVRDVARAYGVAVTIPDLPKGCVVNLASGIPRRMGDILDALLAMSRAAITVEQDRTRMRPSDVPVTVGRADAALALLGWRPAIAWETTLTDVLSAHRAPPL